MGGASVRSQRIHVGSCGVVERQSSAKVVVPSGPPCAQVYSAVSYFWEASETEMSPDCE